MVRVTVIKAVNVCPNGQYLELKAGQTVEGPVAIWLIDQSGCEITIQQDDRPPAAKLSGGEFVLSADAAKGAKPGKP